MKKNTLTLGLSLLLSLLMVGCNKPTPSTGNSEQSSEPQISDSVGGQESSDKQESTGGEESSDKQESTGSSESTGGEEQEEHLHLNTSDLEAGTIHDPVEHNGFTLKGGEDSKGAAKDLTVEGLEEEITLGESTYTQCVKTGGGSSTTAGKEYRIVSFDVEGSGILTIVAKAASSDKVCSVGLLNVTKGLQHDGTDLTTEVAAYTLEFHTSGTYYLTFANSVRFYELAVEVTGESDDDWAPVVEVENPNALSIADLTPGSYDAFSYGNFTFNVGTEGKQFVIEDNDKSKYFAGCTRRLKTGSDSNTVTINVEAAGTITIYMMSSSSSADRTATLTDANGAAVETFTVKGDALYEFNFEVAAGSYTISADGGLNYYAMYVDLA